MHAGLKSVVAGAAILAALVLSNVVAAGVYQVLWPLALELGADDVVIALAVGVIAVACAIGFLAGALHHLPRRISR